MSAYREYELSALKGARAWSRTWFGEGNAILWMTGEPPAGAALDLPPVEARAEPVATPLTSRLQPTSWVTHEQSITALSYLAPNTDETIRAAAILQGRLRRLLRDRDGTSYEIGLDMEALDVATAHVLLTADGPAADVLDVMQETLGAIIDDGPSEEELVRQRAGYLRAMEDPQALPGRLSTLAHARLCGWAPPAPAESRFALDDTSAACVVESVQSAAASALVLVPPGTTVARSLAVAMAEPPPRSIKGHTLKPLRPEHGSPRRRLVVGSAGVTEIDGARQTTVTVDELTAVLTWPDGARAFIGRDGTVVSFDPAQWTGPRTALRNLESDLAPNLVVPMTATMSDPRPKANWFAFAGRTSLLVFGGVVLWLLAAIMWAGVFSGAADANHNPIGPLLYTGLALVVTLSLRGRLIMQWGYRRQRQR